MTMPVEPLFPILRYRRRHLRRRQRRRLAGLVGLGLAIALASRAVVALRPGERTEHAVASAAGAASDDGGSARPHEETLDLDRDQPEAAGSAPPTVDGMDSGRGGQSVAAPAPGAGHNAVLAVAEPADRILAPPERTRLHPVQALAAPRRTAGTARIQIAAVGSAAAGHRLWRRMRQKNADVLHGLEATVERDESSAHAAVYRVEIGPMAQADARRTCDALQRRDVSCLVLHKATG